MKVLITGGAGFIGSHIAAHFCEEAGVEVRVLDNLRSGHRGNLSDLPITLIEGSLNDASAVARAVEGVDYVFHLAAMVSVVETMSQPMACMEMNTLGTLLLLRSPR